ncbi:MAG TPA: mechanosensitive ion channel family protein [Candidatus Angelobacter sp.]|nr:mechanosensitive ion channel family protein [Candidatus Angelobacter sp.]
MKTKRVAVVALGLALLSAATLAGQQAAGNESDGVLAFLEQSVSWYRQVTAQQQLVTEPNDAIVFGENRRIADQVMRLAFEFARGRAKGLDKSSSGAGQGQPAPSSQYQNLRDLVARTDALVKQTEQELAGLKQKLATAPEKKREVLKSQVAEVQSELDLTEARQEVLHNMLEFTSTATNNNAHQSGLSARIEVLARTLPASVTESTASGEKAEKSDTAVVPVAAGERKAESSGIFALLTDTLATWRKLKTLESSLAGTEALSLSLKDIRTPVVAHIRELTHRGDELANQPDSSDPVVLAQQRKELDGLTAQFRQSTVVILPLSKQNVLLDLYKRNATSWRNTVQQQLAATRKSLLWHLAVLGAVLACIFVLSDLWRRMTFRYVQDAHRRHQFLLIRRVVVIVVVVIVVILAFASGLSSVTTFAGLLTAGIAVSLQNVILAVAGYFFLIGKYGVRVGDRIQVSGTTGDVMDIGLIRLHLMEVSGIPAPRPTGRVVAFSNAVVFQPEGIFKQIPGTSFRWHEIKLTASAGSDYRQTEKIMLETVGRIFAEYRERIELQRRSMERVLPNVAMESFDPESRLSLTQEGLQIIVRYAVDLVNATEIDDRMIREVLKATGSEPEIRRGSDEQAAGQTTGKI